jgi:hypothetical protein
MENLSIEISTPGAHEVRTGDLPPIHQSKGFLEREVSIQSLSNFILRRVENGQINCQDAVLVICSASKKAEFISDMNQKNPETYSVSAKFFVEENEVSRAITDAKTFDLPAFRKWVSRMKPYVFYHSEHRKLCDRLMTYSATAAVEISDNKTNQASFAKNYTQQATSKLPQFVQIMFECGQVFKAEICFSIRDNNTTFWLECFEYEHWLVEEQRLQFAQLEGTCIENKISVLEK